MFKRKPGVSKEVGIPNLDKIGPIILFFVTDSGNASFSGTLGILSTTPRIFFSRPSITLVTPSVTCFISG